MTVVAELGAPVVQGLAVRDGERNGGAASGAAETALVASMLPRAAAGEGPGATVGAEIITVADDTTAAARVRVLFRPRGRVVFSRAATGGAAEWSGVASYKYLSVGIIVRSIRRTSDCLGT